MKNAEWADLTYEFETLATQLERDTWHDSTGNVMHSHPAKARIAAMGENALPLIFARMKTDRLHWYGVLAEITGETPVPRESRGRISEMKKHWLQWGRENGHTA